MNNLLSSEAVQDFCHKSYEVFKHVVRFSQSRIKFLVEYAVDSLAMVKFTFYIEQTLT